MAMLNHGNNNNAAAGAVDAGARHMRQALDDPAPALLVVGFATSSAAAVRAALSPPPATASLAYLGALVGAFAGGVGTMWAAVWVADDPARRRHTGRVLFCASLVPMVVAVGLSADFGFFFDILPALVA